MNARDFLARLLTLTIAGLIGAHIAIGCATDAQLEAMAESNRWAKCPYHDCGE